MNHYANKKSAAESMLDVALLMANASQLKAVLEQGSAASFFLPLIVLISISLVLQILVGVLLIFIGMSKKYIRGRHFDERESFLLNNCCKLYIVNLKPIPYAEYEYFNYKCEHTIVFIQFKMEVKMKMNEGR